jgi:hypothetical protein
MTENLGLKALAVMIAATLWVVVFGTKTIEITKEVPFEISASDDQSVEEAVPEKITFRLSGPKAFFKIDYESSGRTDSCLFERSEAGTDQLSYLQ